MKISSLNIKKLFINFLVLFLSFNLVVNSMVEVVNAESNKRVSTFINLASGKQNTNINLNDLSLSKRDLQFLGVYISNFFIPFGTELGTNEDVTSLNKSDIKKALQTNLNFNDSLADSLTETLIALSRSSVKELTLCVSKKYQDTLEPVADMPLNYYTALSAVLGGLQKISDWYPKDANKVIKGIKDGTYEYGYFAYQKDGKYIPVFDFDIDMSSITPSVGAFIKCLESTDIENGYGFNFLDFTSNETGVKEADGEKLKDMLTDSQAYEMSIYGSKLAIDCFGNLIIMGGNHQFIAVPGSMNPYTWVEVDKTGKSVGKGLGGTAYNIANIPSMGLQSNGSGSNTLFSNYSKVSETMKKGTISTRVLADKLKTTQSGLIDEGFALRKIRGNKDDSLGSGIFNLFSSSNFKDLIISATNGYKSVNKKAYNYYDVGSLSYHIYLYGSSKATSGSGGELNILDGFVYIDNLGASHFDDSGEAIDFSTFNVSSYLSDDALSSVRDSMVSWGSAVDNGFSNTYKSIENGSMTIPASVSKEAMIGLYVTYAWSSLYDESSSSAKEETIGKLGYKMNKDALPSIPDEALSIPSSAMSDIMLTSIRDWTYYLLHPTEGIDYFKTWVKNKINGFLVSWHEDMVGSNGTGSINGTTKYRGTSGYVTSPELTDIPWANSLLELYNSAIPFLLVAMILIMLGSYVVGILTLQTSVIGLLIFCITLQLPSAVINGVVGTSNRFSSNLYGEKFTYWALVQHESYSDAIDKAADSDNYDNYLKTLYSKNAQSTGNQGQESIMLKWQAPKKMSSLMLTNNDRQILGSSSKLLSGLINSTYSGESYLDNSNSVYLYRSYIDIANFSRYIHRGLSGSNPKQPVNLNLTSDIKSTWNDSLKEAISNYNTVYEADRALGYANKNGDGSSDGTNNSILRVRLPLSSGIVTEAYGKAGTIKNMGSDDYVGINQDAFQFSIPMFNVGSSGMEFRSTLKTDNFDSYRYSNEDYSGLAAYGLMSENPFYYFSWYLYETGLSVNSNARDGYKNLLLGNDKTGFFYNTQGNGELKDFMDMRSLFTYIIPYLKQGNDIVKEWDDVYGIFIHDGVPTEEGYQDDAEIKKNPELKQKYWHNLNVARLYNIYTPWVDIMYSCSYAKPEKISYLGKSYVVNDPLNPSSYPEDRPMIFSRSEMVDYGLSEHQLTKAERLVLKAQEGMQERLFNLLNYYTFNDTVLNTAASINCAFEFNTVFSENSLFGANNNIYPQSFELSDFSYDAFLRFIIANSTGDSMLVGSNESFYGNVVAKSSTTTVIVMLILDVISIYVIPALKIFFIMGMFILSILIILMTSFKVDPQLKFTKRLGKSFITPMIKFLGINCAMAFIVSLFMGEGNIAVTGSSKPSISLGDPVMVMLAMVVLNCVVLYILVKILLGVFRDIKSSAKLVGGFIGGVAGSVGGLALASAVSNSTKAFNNSPRGSMDYDSPNLRASSRGKTVIYTERPKDREIRKIAYSRRDIKKLEKEYNKKSIRNTNGSSKIDSKISSGLGKLKKPAKSK